MEQNTKFCVVIISKNGDKERVKITVDNLNQNFLEKNEYIIAVNKDTSEEIVKLCNNMDIRYYEYNNQADVYYKLFESLNCDYISFINEGDIYSENFKSKFLRRLETSNNENIFVCPTYYNGIKYILNKNLSKNKTVNIEKEPEKIWINISSCFIKTKLLGNLKKEAKLICDIEQITIVKLISLNGRYEIIRNIKLNTNEGLEDSSDAKLEYYNEDWYFNVFKSVEHLLEFSRNNFDSKISFIQHVCAYILKQRINVNVNVKNKHILLDDKLEEFYKYYIEVLQEINDDVIMNVLGNKRINYYLLRLKYGILEEKIQYREYLDDLCVVNNDKFIFNAADTKIKILLMDYIDKKLTITATYPFPFDEDKLKLYVKYRGELFEAKKNYLFSKYKAFGKVLYDNYTFDVKIPLKASQKKEFIEFYLKGEKSNIKLDINFNKPLSRLSDLKYAYWDCGKFTLNYRQKSILVMNNSKLRHIKREIKYIFNLLRNRNKNSKRSGLLRIIYNLTKPFFNKQIWLFEDKIYKAGDNGEYLFTYASKQKDGIKKYYVLKEGCLDAKRFKREHKKYVTYGSLYHKLLFLNCSVVFGTHNNCTKQHSFDESVEKYFRDLYNSYNTCIQHGLTVQYIPHLTNRINDNLKKFFLASSVEERNMQNKEYAYEGHMDILKVTGSPRYDGLKNNDKKHILITPTWRNYLALPLVRHGESRRYNANFKNSEYFKIYNKLINDEKLIDTARKCGYKIVYLLHPCTSSQIDDYDKNESVELVAATDDLNYEEILTQSSIMVTDYSGVQFDFAYMYKPVVYFHPDELPPSYEEGEYKYQTMALGEIVKQTDELVEILCEYMKNECKIKDEYKERIDKFFKYHDDNNCKRIYEEMIATRKKNVNNKHIT
ncbi:MAG: CDP-glycerol glycerophosphotransferase family protein [Clostridia bacterium]|nr:CDP-glycerol glycerophosphotransferase family protein [Clostridia bacterium]